MKPSDWLVLLLCFVGFLILASTLCEEWTLLWFELLAFAVAWCFRKRYLRMGR